MAKKAGQEIFMDDGFSLDASELDEISAILGATGQTLNANKLGGPKTQAPAPAPAAAPAAFGLKKTNATPPKPAKVITKIVVEEKPVTNVKDVKLRSTGPNAGEIQQSAYNPYKQQVGIEQYGIGSITKGPAMVALVDPEPATVPELNR